MLPTKIQLNNRIRSFIMEERKSIKKKNPLMTADYISEKIGRAKSWLSQIENGRLQSVKKEDLVNAFCFMLEQPKEYIENYLDDQIQFINITTQHNLIDENGNVQDFSEMISFQQARGHIRYAIENLDEIVDGVQNDSVEQIKASLNKNIKYIYSFVIDWLNRSFNDIDHLFSDEVSLINYYLLIETCVQICKSNCDYFGLNAPKISQEELTQLKNKLSENFLLKEKTEVRPLDDYSDYELDEVVKHFSSEEYMLWKNKRVYIGNDPFPMLVNHKTLLDMHTDHYIKYDDVNTLSGLSEEDYLYLIKQIYYQFDIMYKNYQVSLKNCNDYEDNIEELFEENEKLKKQLAQLQKKFSSRPN